MNVAKLLVLLLVFLIGYYFIDHLGSIGQFIGQCISNRPIESRTLFIAVISFIVLSSMIPSGIIDTFYIAFLYILIAIIIFILVCLLLLKNCGVS